MTKNSPKVAAEPPFFGGGPESWLRTISDDFELWELDFNALVPSGRPGVVPILMLAALDIGKKWSTWCTLMILGSRWDLAKTTVVKI